MTAATITSAGFDTDQWQLADDKFSGTWGLRVEAPNGEEFFVPCEEASCLALNAAGVPEHEDA
jgi:hypothetical protein